MIIRGREFVLLSVHSTPILGPCDLELDFEQVLVITGRNGAGKTSFLRAIYSATINSEAHDSHWGELTVVPRTSIKFLEQECVGPLAISGWDYCLHRSGKRLSPWELLLAPNRKEIGIWTLDVLNDLGLMTELDRELRYWSVGSRRMLQILTSLGSPSGVYLLDEPFANLSPEWAAVVRDAISTLAAAGARFVIVSHILPPTSFSYLSIDFSELWEGSKNE